MRTGVEAKKNICVSPRWDCSSPVAVVVVVVFFIAISVAGGDGGGRTHPLRQSHWHSQIP